LIVVVVSPVRLTVPITGRVLALTAESVLLFARTTVPLVTVQVIVLLPELVALTVVVALLGLPKVIPAPLQL
jgi:hypothetical protein